MLKSFSVAVAIMANFLNSADAASRISAECTIKNPRAHISDRGFPYGEVLSARLSSSRPGGATMTITYKPYHTVTSDVFVVERQQSYEGGTLVLADGKLNASFNENETLLNTQFVRKDVTTSVFEGTITLEEDFEFSVECTAWRSFSG